MKIIVSSSGNDMGSSVSGVFGRAPYFILVDTEDLLYEAFGNPAADLNSGAGIQAAQFIMGKKPEALISTNIGPNAFEVLEAGSVPCYQSVEGTVAETVEAFSCGDLRALGSANAESHSGTVDTDGPENGSSELEELSARIETLRGQIAEIVDSIDRLTEEE